MKKVSSYSSYSQFKKKNSAVKEPAKETNFKEIEQLSKQLQVINSLKKINSKKYDHPNGIIEEEEQEDLFSSNIDTKNKISSPAAKKLKQLTNKPDNHQMRNNDNSKMNKSSQVYSLLKKDKQFGLNKDLNSKGGIKTDRKQEQRSKAGLGAGRRMSLTTLGKTSAISTNESMNTTISQTQQPMGSSKKKQILIRISQLSAKVQKREIPLYYFDEIMEKLHNLQQLVEDC